MKGFKFLLTLFIAITAAFLYGCSASDCQNSAPSIQAITTPTSTPSPQLPKGSISGTILDVQQAPVPEATVSLVGSRESFITGQDGKYTFQNLDMGDYELNVRVMANAQTTDPNGGPIIVPLVSTATRNVTLTQTEPNKTEDFALKNATIAGKHTIIDGQLIYTPMGDKITLYDSEGNLIETQTWQGGTAYAETFSFTLNTFLPQTYSKVKLTHRHQTNNTDYTEEKNNITIPDSAPAKATVDLTLTIQ